MDETNCRTLVYAGALPGIGRRPIFAAKGRSTPFLSLIAVQDSRLGVVATARQALRNRARNDPAASFGRAAARPTIELESQHRCGPADHLVFPSAVQAHGHSGAGLATKRVPDPKILHNYGTRRQSGSASENGRLGISGEDGHTGVRTGPRERADCIYALGPTSDVYGRVDRSGGRTTASRVSVGGSTATAPHHGHRGYWAVSA